MITSLRQMCFPREFRIAPPCWPEDMPVRFERLAAALLSERPTVDPPAVGSPPNPDLKAQERLLADVCTGLWRLRGRMLKPDSDEPLDEMRRAYRHLQSVWDALRQAGIEIRDHTGELVPEGGIYALKTIAFEPRPGFTRETVIETIRPSVYYRSETIQMGEVIIGTPPRPEEAAPGG